MLRLAGAVVPSAVRPFSKQEVRRYEVRKRRRQADVAKEVQN
jgi:hypothetical protein